MRFRLVAHGERQAEPAARCSRCGRTLKEFEMRDPYLASKELST